MKLFLTAIIFIILSSIQITNAQQDNERLRKTINDANTVLEKESRKPQWQQKYNIYMSGGNYYMSIGEYKNAIKGYNLALKYVPGDPVATQKLNYCKRMLKKK
jgi:tetratricopeptide (TPR) repeat protein